MALWLSPLLPLWARLRVRAIISPAWPLGVSCWGPGTERPLPAPCLYLQVPRHRLLALSPALSLPLVPCLEPQGKKLEDLDSRAGAAWTERKLEGVLFRAVSDMDWPLRGPRGEPEQERKQQRERALRANCRPFGLSRLMKTGSKGPGVQPSGLSPSRLNTKPASLSLPALGRGCWAWAGCFSVFVSISEEQ